MRELIRNYDVWSLESDVFDHTATVWKEEDSYYQLRVRHGARQGSFDLDSLPTPVRPIPMDLFNLGSLACIANRITPTASRRFLFEKSGHLPAR